MAQLLDPHTLRPVTAADLTEGDEVLVEDTRGTMSGTVVEIDGEHVTVQSRAAQRGGYNMIDPLTTRG